MAFEQRLEGGADKGHMGIWQKIKNKGTEGGVWRVHRTRSKEGQGAGVACGVGSEAGAELTGGGQIMLGL